MQKLDILGRDDLFYKIVDGENKEAIELLDKTTDINSQDKNGYSYLHIAAQSRSFEITKEIVKRGAEIDIKDKYGKTPLMVAISNYDGDDKIIKLLIENGANKENQTNTGVSCMKFAEMKGIII